MAAWLQYLPSGLATKDTYLFSVSDLPIMERFDIEQEQVLDTNNGKQEVTSEFNAVFV